MSFDERILRDENSGLTLDLTDLRGDPGPHPDLHAALDALAAIEAGAVANADEGRMVGHYWLRDPALAPDPRIRAEIEEAREQCRGLELGDHTDILWIGIGGSALGPQLLHDCLRQGGSPRVLFLDNTDPDGLQQALSAIDPARTLAVVVSKSGGTVETYNGMVAAQARYAAAGAAWEDHAVAITGHGSTLWKAAAAWRARVPLWDWVGGRTSVTGTVGWVLLALCGYDLDAFLAGARAADEAGRRRGPDNPAAALAAAWYAAGGGRGDRVLVFEPYKDRLQLLARYLQQLIMESLGKALDRQGRPVHQGLTVYGNKGSTDQHAFVQQLRDGRDDALVHFLDVADPGPELPGADGHPAGDHLLGFLCGTRAALAEAGRPTLTVQVPDASARSLGALIALFERAVGLYAELIDVNAYHQPGVEAGKKAAKSALALLDALEARLDDTPRSAADLAADADADPRLSWRLLHHLAATGRAQVRPGGRPADDAFWNAP